MSKLYCCHLELSHLKMAKMTSRQGREFLKLAAAAAEHMIRQRFNGANNGPIIVSYGRPTRRGKRKTFDIHPVFQWCCGCGKNEGTEPFWGFRKLCSDCKKNGLPFGGFTITLDGTSVVRRTGVFKAPAPGDIAKAIYQSGGDFRIVRVSGDDDV